MRRFIFCAILGGLMTAPTMFADVVDYLLNVNGSLYCDSGSGVPFLGDACTGSNAPSTSPNTGLTSAGAGGTLSGVFNNANSGTGLGTVTMTYNPGVAGDYDVNLWLFEELEPSSGYDEFGGSGGTLASGESWQIDVPDYDAGGDPNTSATGTIIYDTINNSLSDANDVPGGVSSYTACGGGASPATSPDCNDYTSVALGQSFTLTAGEEELLTWSVSTTAPSAGVFYLSQTDPGDITGQAETYYYALTAQTVPVGVSVVPEPSMAIPMLVLAGVLFFAVRRRRASASA